MIVSYTAVNIYNKARTLWLYDADKVSPMVSMVYRGILCYYAFVVQLWFISYIVGVPEFTVPSHVKTRLINMKYKQTRFKIIDSRISWQTDKWQEWH